MLLSTPGFTVVVAYHPHYAFPRLRIRMVHSFSVIHGGVSGLISRVISGTRVCLGSVAFVVFRTLWF